MVREFFWMSHISTEERLKDINLTIYEGEILFLLSNHRGELEEIWQIIAGYRKKSGGMMFLEEKRVFEYNEEIAAAHGIFHIDTSAQLVESLSIAENIFAVRKRKQTIPLSFYNRKAIMQETEQVLKKVGMSCAPGTKIWQLEPFGRFQVCLAKAIISGAKLLLIDDVENEYNALEKHRILELIQRLRNEKIASLILADRPGELLEGARKIVLIKNGRDIKTYFSQDKGYFSQTALYHTVMKNWLGVSEGDRHMIAEGEGGCGRKKALLSGSQVSQELKSGHIYGFYDGFWDKEKDFWAYLQDFKSCNQAELYFEEEKKVWSLEELVEMGKAVYIPKESAFFLLENVGIGKNIAIPNKSRAEKSGGISVNRIDSYLEEEFCRKFSIPVGTPVWELSCVQKKILSIQRWLLQKPEILILEDPTYRLNIQEADRLREYLRRLSKAEMMILISESSFYEEELICDVIIHTVKNRYKTTIYREDYQKIKAEWLF